jgi:hypothetical protein
MTTHQMIEVGPVSPEVWAKLNPKARDALLNLWALGHAPTDDTDQWGLVCEPCDVLHPDDWRQEDFANQPRRLHVGLAENNGAYRVGLGIKDSERYARLVLTAGEVRKLIDSLTRMLDDQIEE